MLSVHRSGASLCCQEEYFGYAHPDATKDVKVAGLRRQFPLKGHSWQHEQFYVNNAPLGTLGLNE